MTEMLVREQGHDVLADSIDPGLAEHARPLLITEAEARELGDWALLAHDGSSKPGAGASQESGEAGSATGGGEQTADQAGTPPGGGGQERGEDEREVIARCDFREYFKQKTFGDEWADDSQITGFERYVEQELGEHGYYARLLIRELRSNYYDYCAVDIYAGVDSGHRVLEVSKNKAGDYFIDYIDDDEVTSETYNVYAESFGQPLEPINGQIPERVGRVAPDAKRATSIAQLDEVTDEGVDSMLVFGNARELSDVGEGGRGIPLIMKYTDIHEIKRGGPDNRGTRLHLRLKREIPPDENMFQIDLADLLNTEL